MTIHYSTIERELSRGFIRFVIFRGILTFGVISSAIYLFLSVFLSGNEWAELWKETLTLVFPGGSVWGICMWYFYKHLLNKRHDNKVDQ